MMSTKGSVPCIGLLCNSRTLTLTVQCPPPPVSMTQRCSERRPSEKSQAPIFTMAIFECTRHSSMTTPELGDFHISAHALAYGY